MNFVKCENLPKRENHRLQAYWKEFMKSNEKIIKIELHEGEYSRIKTAYTVMHVSLKKSGLPIRITVQKGELYLVRTDM